MTAFFAEINDQKFKVNVFADIYLPSLFNLVRDFNSCDNSISALKVIKKYAIPDLPEDVAVPSVVDSNEYNWSPLLSTEEIIAFVCDIIAAQQNLILNALSEKRKLTPKDKDRIKSAKTLAKAMEASAIKMRQGNVLSESASDGNNKTTIEVEAEEISEGKAFLQSLEA